MKIPRATYRLQLREGTGFREAADLVGYLSDLGVSHLYLSPVQEAREGSTHGYDVVRPERLDPALGGEEGFEALTAALEEEGMGLLLDIVPNHMAAVPENPWWRSLLAHGRASRHEPFFDVRWERPEPALAGRLVLPLLGRPLHEHLEAGEIDVVLEEDGFALRHPGGTLPLDPATWDEILRGLVPVLESELGAESEAFQGLLACLDLVETIPPVDGEGGREARRERCGEEALRRLLDAHPEVRGRLERLLARIDGTSGRPETKPDTGPLERLLERQPWRLMWWRAGLEEINYRRFFDIDHLAGVRVEEPTVFEAVHGLPLELVRRGVVDGLRIDHVDGLRLPESYLRRLAEALSDAAEGEPWLLVEKILASDESLPESWPVAGTTGYEFLVRLERLSVDPEGLARLEDDWAQRYGDPRTLVTEARREVLARLFPPELRRLQAGLHDLACRDPIGRDLRRSRLHTALVETTAALDVYRTYAEKGAVREDRARVSAAAERAREAAPDCVREIEFLERVLLDEDPPARDGEARRRFVLDWQQLTGPVAAKGVEDTALYRDATLLSLDEVGSEPGIGGLGQDDLHRWCAERTSRRARGLLCTSSHDTKRSEDVRARIAVLSELAEEWMERRDRWRLWNAPLRRQRPEGPVPSELEESFLYQTLLGVWPLGAEEEPALRPRLESYLLKASREAKRRTSWREPDEGHEEALVAFLRDLLDPGRSAQFLEDFRAFQERVAFFGAVNGLTRTLLKCVCPGIPDVYQGTELWDLSLVDPDNRRLVDFDRRRSLLGEIRSAAVEDPEALAQELRRTWKDGRIKLFLLQEALRLRASHPEVFDGGSYLPVPVRGERGDHAVALLRRREDVWVLAAATLRPAGLVDGEPRWPVGEAVWGEAVLVLPEEAPREWRCTLTGRALQGDPSEGSLRLAAILDSYPVALLASP